jgi:hypothetical protein
LSRRLQRRSLSRRIRGETLRRWIRAVFLLLPFLFEMERMHECTVRVTLAAKLGIRRFFSLHLSLFLSSSFFSFLYIATERFTKPPSSCALCCTVLCSLAIVRLLHSPLPPLPGGQLACYVRPETAHDSHAREQLSFSITCLCGLVQWCLFCVGFHSPQFKHVSHSVSLSVQDCPGKRTTDLNIYLCLDGPVC